MAGQGKSPLIGGKIAPRREHAKKDFRVLTYYLGDMGTSEIPVAG